MGGMWEYIFPRKRERVKRFREQIEEEKQAYGSCSRQKEYDVIVFVHGDIRPTVEKRALRHGCSVLDRRNMDKTMESRAKTSMFEAGERACRSSDV